MTVPSGCPGSRMQDFRGAAEAGVETQTKVKSELRQWPVQMHLISPTAPYFQGADVVLTADCVGYAMGGFHPEYLKGKSIGVACPKLDQGQEVYLEKVKAWLDEAKINTLTVMIMQVPCCRGLDIMVRQALEKSGLDIPLETVTIGINGEKR